MVDYIRAIKRPFTDYKKLIIGLLFSVPIPLVGLITNNIARGYALECGATAAKGNYVLPEWSGYKRLWTNSVVAALIGLVYTIPVLILLVVFGRQLIIDYISDSAAFSVNALQSPVDLISNYGIEVVFIGVVYIVILYFTPIATLNWVIYKKFRSAFDFKNIFKKVFTKRYFIAWTILSGVGLGIGLISWRLIPADALGSLNEPGANFAGLAARFILVSFFLTITQFIQSIFTFTMYGNVIEELNITEDSASTPSA